MRIEKVFIISLSLFACAPTTENIRTGEHRAGLKTKIWYKTVDDSLRVLRAKGISNQDLEIERQILPKGGYVYIDRKNEVHIGPGQVGMGPVLKNGDISVQFFQINVNNQMYYICNDLEWQRQPQSIFGKIFSASSIYGICKVEKPIDTTFDVILYNASRTPIGKYKIPIGNN